MIPLEPHILQLNCELAHWKMFYITEYHYNLYIFIDILQDLWTVYLCDPLNETENMIFPPISPPGFF